MNYLNLDQKKTKLVKRYLDRLLADLHIHYQNLRSAHWNMRGILFFNLHVVLEEEYEIVKTQIDEVAERIRALQYHPVSKLSEMVSITNLDELNERDDAAQMIKHLLRDKSIIITDIRDAIEQAQNADDDGTIDLIAGLLSNFEKHSWMLNAWLQNQESSHDRKYIEETKN